MKPSSTPKNILITGVPGVGKTTLIRKLADSLSSLSPVGFYTEEIRRGDVREGFALVSLDGSRQPLAHVRIAGVHKVGKYGVDVKGFEAFLERLDFFNPANKLIVIDEIGKMECLSVKFKELLREIFDSEKTVLATIALKGTGIIKSLKRRPDVTLFTVTPRNRNNAPTHLMPLLQPSDVRR